MEGLKQVVTGQIKALTPAVLQKKPHFNFITIHYFWIIGFSLLGSVLIFASGKSGTGDIPYIDALLFASGANTQAGLNTVDINLLNTFQQIVIFLCAMMSNPITINSFVVFLRLYWFEKRFQHVVREARRTRGTLSKSKSRAKNDPDQIERGVNGRNITIMTDGGRSRITNDGILLDGNGTPINARYPSMNGKVQTPGPVPDEHDEDDLDPMSPPVERQESRRLEVKFADTVKKSDGLGEDAVKLPARRPDEDHIAFLEKQRNANNGEVLRIPGPRDADRGMLPQLVTDDDAEEVGTGMRRALSEDSTRQAPPQSARAITIAEPEKPRRSEETAHDRVTDDARAAAHTFSPLRLRKPRLFSKKDQKLHHDEDALHPVQTNRSRRRQTFDNIRTALSRDKDEELAPYLSWEPTLGRNSAFPGLSEEQREELGGIEYRSLKTLALVLVCYFWGFWFFGITCLAPWINTQSYYGNIVDNAGQNKVWWGFWTANSAFMDLGYTITPDSMNSFNTAVFPLLIMAFLIVIGNTGFPVMLRFIIWLTSLVLPRNSGLYEEIRFLLDHPRRCFTLLFPSGATWWLFWLLVILNALDLLFFVILDLGPGVVSNMPVGIRVLDGLFQAMSTRTAGFSCVNLAELHPAVQTSYLIMMYISIFPIAISVRRTNVYEENSLGIYTKNENDDSEGSGSDMEYVGAHLRRQLSFDLWFIFIGFFILSISEGPKIMAKENPISMFAILFEIVSAYGTVGLSLGFTGVNTSLCAQFSVVGKLVVIAMMIRGRHRGLPYGLDRAILLPSESLNAKEAADADARAARRASVVSNATHHSVAGRGRTRSISADRGNGILTSFLHPGPAVWHDPPPLTGNSFMSRRSHTDPVFDDYEFTRPRRVETVTTVNTTGH